MVHAYPDGAAPGAAPAVRVGLSYQVVPAVGISEDVALLLTYEKGAELIAAAASPGFAIGSSFWSRPQDLLGLS